MRKLTGNEIKRMFLEFFKEKGHVIEPGASLIPYKDPTLLWINSGVAALKKYFDGSEMPKSNRITNAQKCIRTNDIENVGKTARHHTFFEMMGNFSIGDYFKKEALEFAWEILTSEKWFGLDPEKIYVTVYIDDQEAYDIWVNEIGFNPNRILKTPGNYWEIGEGPCGPNSEIFYDRGEKYDPEHLGEKLFFEELENDRYVEIWGIVFSQYNAQEGFERNEYKELPQKNIDTGLGYERLVSVIQETETNFDTDVFLPLMNGISAFTKFPYEGKHRQGYQVIADHIRTVTFALSDGAIFSNEGRGYVLRRVLRRAVRYGLQLEINEPFMYRLVEVVANSMNEFYPYLQEKKELVAKLVKIEEETFHSTLVNGEKLLMEELQKLDGKELSGRVMFKLYDTYGFPKELTMEIVEEKGYTVNIEEFKEEMEEQKERARKARSSDQSMASQSEDLMNFDTPTTFTGYTDTTSVGKIIGLFENGNEVSTLKGDGVIILETTCFYAESGGQVGDTGVLYNDKVRMDVVDVRKAPQGQPMHFVRNKNQEIHVGDVLHGEIDVERRLRIKANHSSVHLLQSALKKVVGDHITQAGSFVTDEYARFDFTHFEKLSEEHLTEIEKLVNQMIMSDNSVVTELMSIDQAKTSGATALFDEKYGDIVRVVTMGDVSKELCGGTHVSNTQEIGVFKIESEESVGSGIRRLTTKTKLDAYSDFVLSENLLKELASKLKLNSVGLVDEKLDSLLEELGNLKKELAVQKGKMMVLEADQVITQAKEINGLNILLLSLKDQESSGLKDYAEILKNKCKNSVVFIANQTAEDKVTFVAAVSKAAIDKGVKAGDLVTLAASLSDGKGGGRPDIAQGGGSKPQAIQEIFKTIETKIH